MVDHGPQRRAQLEYLGQDDRLRESAALVAALTVAERLREGEALCAEAASLLARLPDDVRERAITYREALPADADPVLRRLAGLDPPGPPWT